MNTHADKTQENKGQSVANEVVQKQGGGEATFQFVDNRPEAIAQRKLRVMANNSPQVSQLRAFQEMANTFTEHRKQLVQDKNLDSVQTNHPLSVDSKSTIQMKSDRQYGALSDGSGTLADYFIDPLDPLVGKSPPSSRPPWWDSLKSDTGSFPESSLVQGHLVNHHVGGEDDMQNLTPITRSANTTMLNFFEKDVKNEYDKASTAATSPVIHYKVDATGYGNIEDIETLGGPKLLQPYIAPFLPCFAEWIGAEYDIYPRVKGDRSDLYQTPIFEIPKKKWVKNENKDEKGSY